MSVALEQCYFSKISNLRRIPFLNISLQFFSKNSFLLWTLSILSIIILISLFVVVIHKTKKISSLTEELQAEKVYNQTLSVLHDNMRCFKHDFNNIVQAIGGYIDFNDMEGLRTYYTKLYNDCKKTNNLEILNPQIINNPSIYSILTTKYFLALENSLTINISVFTDLSTINFNIYELTRILGILLDNAIEAAQESIEKSIAIEIKSDSKKQLFIISNSCDQENISIDKIFQKGYSTKERNSGIGLWEVHNILAKNEQANLYTNLNNHRFIQQLEIYYKQYA